MLSPVDGIAARDERPTKKRKPQLASAKPQDHKDQSEDFYHPDQQGQTGTPCRTICFDRNSDLWFHACLAACLTL
jgi:hypothetical protein